MIEITDSMIDNHYMSLDPSFQDDPTCSCGEDMVFLNEEYCCPECSHLCELCGSDLEERDEGYKICEDCREDI